MGVGKEVVEGLSGVGVSKQVVGDWVYMRVL